MQGESQPEMLGVGYATRRMTQPPDWHDLVAFDMLFNNVTTGLFLVAAAGDLAAPGVFGAVARLAYPVALAFLTADLLCLVLDLGDPLRFHHMLRVFKPSSPMSLGTWSLTAYSLPLTLIVALVALRWLGVASPEGAIAGWLRRVAVITGIPFALASAMYKGVLFSTTSQPGWRGSRWLGAYLTDSAITMGCAGMLAIATVMGEGRASSALRPSLIILLGINLVFLAMVAAELRPSLREVGGGRLRMAFDLGALLGVVVPFVLIAVSGGIVPVLVATVGVLAGNFLMRWAIVMLPHEPRPGD